MIDEYLGAIRLWPLANAPKGWANCDGTILDVNKYQALFSLLGNKFGGDVSKGTFALPDLRGLGIIGSDAVGNPAPKNPVGSVSGSYTVTLHQTEIPNHTHGTMIVKDMPVQLLMSCDAAAGDPTSDPVNAVPSAAHADIYASTNSHPVTMISAVPNTPTMKTSVQPNIGNIPHSNMMPSLGLNYIICVNSPVFPMPS